MFYVDVPPGDKHTLRVLVDSRLDGNDLGLNQPKYDFMQYGGILRSVVLHVVPGATMVEGVDVMQGASGKGDATLRFRLHRFDASRDPVHVQATARGRRKILALRVWARQDSHCGVTGIGGRGVANV